MFYELLTRKFEPAVASFDCTYRKLQSEQVSKNGVLTKKSVIKRFSSADVLNKFNADDFNLSNILSTGAFDMLKPTYMVDTNNLNVVDQVEKTIKNIKNEQSVS